MDKANTKQSRLKRKKAVKIELTHRDEKVLRALYK